MKQYNGEPLKIESCWAKDDCPSALDNFERLQKIIQDVVEESNFSAERKEMLQGKIKPHQVFKICLAGCPNCCSQPQIKDFGLYKVVYPEVKEQLCTLCNKCIKACREKAISPGGKSVKINSENCIGCGDCIRVCPVNAITRGKEAWRIIAGGKLGRHPRLAVDVAEIADEEEVKQYLQDALKVVLEAPGSHVRFGDLIEKYLHKIEG
ncbi:MAG: 4Fe-4S ferredoxin [Clostridiales bacterium]|nr:4Fe-4S ferredoxin [Clostridiales bacterium]